ncbi:MAG: DUF3108 domain-containing protein [Myxococcales bacterium]|nr:DUF3108 domain-containing protein [Myxococcales bacterium]MCB9532004.1 DUF3108 domain-containing protein [Myxococcales bacterium]MCB9533850.1 DUF3108 domain-containing protein [Myxococcales bacterium]
MRPIALALCACLAAVPAVADELPQDTAAERFRWSGEQLFYSIEMLGSEAARCAISVGYPTEGEDGETYVPLEGLSISVGFFANVYPMEDTALTRMDLSDGLPTVSTKIIDERGSVRRYDVAYGHDLFRSEIDRSAGEELRRNVRLVPSDTHDAITWMLDLRSRDLSVGQSYVYHVFDGWKLSRLTARVTAHTDVYTELGLLDVAEMRFTREVLASYSPLPYANDLVTLPPVYTVTEGPQDLGVGWFSLDDRRLPVGVDIETPIGHVRMLLDRWVAPG